MLTRRTLLACARPRAARALSTTPVRPFFSSNAARADAAAAPAAPDLGTVAPQRRPVGGFRGGLFGFLLGFSAASAAAAYSLLEEYARASAALQASVDELRASTQKVSAHVQRIAAVEQELRALTASAAGKEDVARARGEAKRLYDGLHLEFLDLKSHVWGIQQDLHAVAKKDAAAVRVV